MSSFLIINEIANISQLLEAKKKINVAKRNNSINGVHVYIMKFSSAYYLGGFIKTI